MSHVGMNCVGASSMIDETPHHIQVFVLESKPKSRCFFASWWNHISTPPVTEESLHDIQLSLFCSKLDWRIRVILVPSEGVFCFGCAIQQKSNKIHRKVSLNGD